MKSIHYKLVRCSPGTRRKFRTAAVHRIAAAVATMLVLCILCASTAHAEFVEYYNYTIDDEGDTTLVIVASFDTLAMQLRAEIRQSPLGTAVETSDLTDEGGGYLSGEVTVSVTGDGGQSVSFMSQFVYLPSYGPTHTEIVDADFNLPAVMQAGSANMILLQQFIKVDTQITTNVDTQSGETETTTEVIISTPLGIRTDLTFKESVTTSKEGVETKQSVELELESKDGTSMLKGDFSLSESTSGEKTGSFNVEAAVSDSGLVAGARVGIEKTSDETTSNIYLFALYRLIGSAAARFWLDYRSGADLDRYLFGGSLIGRLDDDVSGEIGFEHDAVENRTSFILGLRYGFWAATVTDGKVRPLAAMSQSPPGLNFRGTSQSTFCCPDTNSCVERAELTREVPANNCEAYGMVYGCSFQPSDPNSLSESLSVSCQSPPGHRGKEKIRDIPKVEGREPLPDLEGAQGGRYLSTIPNPFNPETRITFETFAEEHVTVQVYDVSGRRVRALASAVFPMGRNHVIWDGRDDAGNPVAGGVYFVVLMGKGWRATGRAVLLK